MSAETNKAIIRRWIEEGWNQGKADLADELYADEFIARDTDDPNHLLRGPAGIRQYLIQLRSTFPDIHFTIDHLFGEGNLVVGAFTIRGTHQGYYGDLPPSGRRVEFKAVDIWRIVDGKIVERCIASIDRLGLLQQLGALPSSGSGSGASPE
jgi:steroid delta-isomerase-like uncharacterized protein